MKRNIPVLAALAALLALALGGAGALAAGPSMETEVSISFKELVYFDRMLNEGGMDIDFGTQPLPLPNTATLYLAPDGPHTLRVRDGRVKAGNWTVSAKMSAYFDDPKCTGVIYLYDPARSDGLTPNLSPSQPAPHLASLEFTGISVGEKQIVNAGPNLTQGSYDLEYAPGRVGFHIGGGNATNAEVGAYTSTIIWTLTLKP